MHARVSARFRRALRSSGRHEGLTRLPWYSFTPGNDTNCQQPAPLGIASQKERTLDRLVPPGLPLWDLAVPDETLAFLIADSSALEADDVRVEPARAHPVVAMKQGNPRLLVITAERIDRRIVERVAGPGRLEGHPACVEGLLRLAPVVVDGLRLAEACIAVVRLLGVTVRLVLATVVGAAVREVREPLRPVVGLVVNGHGLVLLRCLSTARLATFGRRREGRTAVGVFVRVAFGAVRHRARALLG